MNNETINRAVHWLIGLPTTHQLSAGKTHCVNCTAFDVRDTDECPDVPIADYCASLDLTAKAEKVVIDMVGEARYAGALTDSLHKQCGQVSAGLIATAPPLTRCLALLAAAGVETGGDDENN